MGEEVNEKYAAAMRRFLEGNISRANLLKAAGVGAVAATIPGIAAAQVGGTGRAPYSQYPFLPDPRLTQSGTYTTEAAGDILNIAQTAEHLAVTFLTAALGNASTLGLTGLTLDIVQAILASEIAHLQFLTAAGATPLTTSFTVPDPAMLTDYTAFFKTLEVADTIFTGAYLAAIREFAEAGQPQLAKIAGQFMGVEAEHRVLARAALALKGDTTSIPPNNKAFETDLFLYVREAAAVITQLGFIGGKGTPAAFPGLTAAIAAAGPAMGQITQVVPNQAAEGSTTTSNITAQRTQTSTPSPS